MLATVAVTIEPTHVKAGLFAITSMSMRMPRCALRGEQGRTANVRVLVYEARCVVDFVVDDDVKVLLSVVLRDVGVGKFLVGRHCGGGRGNSGYVVLRQETEVVCLRASRRRENWTGRRLR